MALRNYLIEGISGTGKTSVAGELERRGYHVVHGDRVLAYQGDPETGGRLDPARCSDDPAFINAHHIWNVDEVKTLIADRSRNVTFFCGASRNRDRFVDLFDAVFVLEADWDTISRRLDGRPDEWGTDPRERALIAELHTSRIDLPLGGIPIDAARPLAEVVDAILGHC